MHAVQKVQDVTEVQVVHTIAIWTFEELLNFQGLSKMAQDFPQTGARGLRQSGTT